MACSVLYVPSCRSSMTMTVRRSPRASGFHGAMLGAVDAGFIRSRTCLNVRFRLHWGHEQRKPAPTGVFQSPRRKDRRGVLRIPRHRSRMAVR